MRKFWQRLKKWWRNYKHDFMTGFRQGRDSAFYKLNEIRTKIGSGKKEKK